VHIAQSQASAHIAVGSLSKRDPTATGRRNAVRGGDAFGDRPRSSARNGSPNVERSRRTWPLRAPPINPRRHAVHRGDRDGRRGRQEAGRPGHAAVWVSDGARERCRAGGPGDFGHPPCDRRVEPHERCYGESNAPCSIETGPVVVDAAGEIFGDAPNVASRVQALAGPGSSPSAAIRSRVCRRRYGVSASPSTVGIRRPSTMIRKSTICSTKRRPRSTSPSRRPSSARSCRLSSATSIIHHVLMGLCRCLRHEAQRYLHTGQRNLEFLYLPWVHENGL
jgi:hypothetical protein